MEAPADILHQKYWKGKVLPVRHQTSIHRDMVPYIASGLAATACILGAVILPHIMRPIDESREKARIESIEKRITGEVDSIYHKALKMIESQEYREFAITVYSLYSQEIYHYTDSLNKVHPINPADGRISAEMAIASDLIMNHNTRLQSIYKTLPSIQELPYEVRQEKGKDFEKRLLKEYEIKMLP